jgi:NAD(P)-dependent dehydrogenase (short-subunit alcohol dehydrogenase family)
LKSADFGHDKDQAVYPFAAAAGLGIVAGVVLARIFRPGYSFKDKTVLITGGTRGLGLVLARQFASEGARIAVCSRGRDEVERAYKDLSARGAQVLSTVCDVRDRENVLRLVAEVRGELGPIDVLINNAGVIQVGPLEVQTQQDFEDAMSIHFWAPYYAMQAVVPDMRARGEGRIANIASIGGKIAVPHLAPYCASKFALAGLSSAMTAELAKDGIRVTTVYPGLMRTGSHINALFKGKNEAEFALFSIMNGLPLTSISAESAAQEIVSALRHGRASAVISLQAKIANTINSLFPEVTSEIFAITNRFLPGEGGVGKGYATGLESTSAISPSILTALVDRASTKNNELRPGESIA